MRIRAGSPSSVRRLGRSRPALGKRRGQLSRSVQPAMRYIASAAALAVILAAIPINFDSHGAFTLAGAFAGNGHGNGGGNGNGNGGGNGNGNAGGNGNGNAGGNGNGNAGGNGNGNAGGNGNGNAGGNGNGNGEGNGKSKSTDKSESDQGDDTDQGGPTVAASGTQPGAISGLRSGERYVADEIV